MKMSPGWVPIAVNFLDKVIDIYWFSVDETLAASAQLHHNVVSQVVNTNCCMVSLTQRAIMMSIPNQCIPPNSFISGNEVRNTWWF